jgi:TPR repeat protein
MRAKVLWLLAAIAGMIGIWVAYQSLDYHKPETFKEGMEALKEGEDSVAIAKLTPYAKAGNIDAQRALGQIYATGVGSEADNIRAAIWFRRAECGCEAPGRSEYGIALDLQKGGRMKAAAEWVRRAAEAGYPKAQELLADQGRLQEMGLNISTDVSDYWRAYLHPD